MPPYGKGPAARGLQRLEGSIADHQAMVVNRKPSLVVVNEPPVQPNMHGAKPSLW